LFRELTQLEVRVLFHRGSQEEADVGAIDGAEALHREADAVRPGGHGRESIEAALVRGRGLGADDRGPLEAHGDAGQDASRLVRNRAHERARGALGESGNGGCEHDEARENKLAHEALLEGRGTFTVRSGSTHRVGWIFLWRRCDSRFSTATLSRVAPPPNP